MCESFHSLQTAVKAWKERNLSPISQWGGGGGCKSNQITFTQPEEIRHYEVQQHKANKVGLTLYVLVLNTVIYNKLSNIYDHGTGKLNGILVSGQRSREYEQTKFDKYK